MFNWGGKHREDKKKKNRRGWERDGLRLAKLLGKVILR